MVPESLRARAQSGDLPTTEDMAFIRQTAQDFDGMMMDLSLVQFTVLLREQTKRGVSGNLTEFGVYRGKSASAMALSAPLDAKIHLVDIADYPEKDKLALLHPKIEVYKARSEDLLAASESDNFRDIRFSHHDASHFMRNVETEILLIKDRMRHDGLIVLDDFGFHYSQVMAAYFHLRYIHKLPFEAFLVSANKAFLCHEDMFAHYEKLMCEGILDQIRDIGLDCYVARTDNDSRHRAFHIAPKKGPDQPDFYGVNFMGDQFYKPGAKPYTPG